MYAMQYEIPLPLDYDMTVEPGHGKTHRAYLWS